MGTLLYDNYDFSNELSKSLLNAKIEYIQGGCI